MGKKVTVADMEVQSRADTVGYISVTTGIGRISAYKAVEAVTKAVREAVQRGKPITLGLFGSIDYRRDYVARVGMARIHCSPLVFRPGTLLVNAAREVAHNEGVALASGELGLCFGESSLSDEDTQGRSS